jgi:hypothetical protein
MEFNILELSAITMRDELLNLVKLNKTDELYYKHTKEEGCLCQKWTVDMDSTTYMDNFVGHHIENQDIKTYEQFAGIWSILQSAIDAGLYFATRNLTPELAEQKQNNIINIINPETNAYSIPSYLIAWLTTDNFRWHDYNGYYCLEFTEDFNYGLVLEFPEFVLGFAAYVLYYRPALKVVPLSAIYQYKADSFSIADTYFQNYPKEYRKLGKVIRSGINTKGKKWRVRYKNLPLSNE